MEHPTKTLLKRIQAIVEKEPAAECDALATFFRKAADTKDRETKVFVSLTNQLGKMPSDLAERAIAVLESISGIQS